MNESNQKKIRIVAAVKKKYPQFSHKHIKSFIEDNIVQINHRAAKMHDWVLETDHVVIPSQFLKTNLVPNDNVDCQLIKKTKDYILLQKGPFVHSVAHDFSETNSVANWLLVIDSHLSEISDPLESGLVHRLDYETSGVMVAARNLISFDHLKKSFKRQKVNKEYVCLVSDRPPSPGVYVAYAGKKSGSSKKIHIQKIENKSKKLKKIKTEILSSKQLEKHKFLLTVRLISGYRHQIRAHLNMLGCPIIGDDLYGGLASKRLKLHAYKISFIDLNGKTIFAESNLSF